MMESQCKVIRDVVHVKRLGVRRENTCKEGVQFGEFSSERDNFVLAQV